MQTYKVLYAVTRGNRVHLLEQWAWPNNCRLNLGLVQGGEAEQFLAVLEALQALLDDWWHTMTGTPAELRERIDEALAGTPWHKVPGRTAASKQPGGAVLRMEEANRVAKSCGPDLTFRIDVESKTLSVNSGWDLEAMPLTVPLDLDKELAWTLRRNAVSIGFGLGTDERRRTRRFLPPWARIAECLAAQDPAQSLADAAGADTLRDRLWVETEEQRSQSETGYLCWLADNNPKLAKRLLGLHIPGVFRGGIEAVLHFAAQEDGSLTLFLPCCWENFDLAANNVFPAKQVTLTGMRANRGSVAALAKEIELDRPGTLMQSLRRLAWVVHFMDLALATHVSNDSLAAILLAYAQSRLPESGALLEPVLRGTPLPLLWSQVRDWTNVYADKRAHRLSGRLAGEGEDVPLLFRAPEGDWMPHTHHWLGVELDAIMAAEAERTAGKLTQLPASVRKHLLLQRLESFVDEVLTPGQSVYALEPELSGRVGVGTVEYTGGQFVFRRAADGQDRPVDDLLAAGGGLFSWLSSARAFLRELGRDGVLPTHLFRKQGYMDRRALDAIKCYKNDAQIRAQVSALTVPCDWDYVIAVFRGGVVGIAYGPRLGQEYSALCMERLYREAADSDPSTALYLFP